MKSRSKKVEALIYWEYLKDMGASKDSMVFAYKNVWDEEILNVSNSENIIVNKSSEKDRLPGNSGYNDEKGFYINDENGEEILSKNNLKEYNRLQEKYINLELLIKKVNYELGVLNLYVNRGPNDSVTIFDTDIVVDCYWVLPKNRYEIELFSNEIIKQVNSFVTNHKEHFFMDVSKLEECVIQSVCNLDISYLSELDEDIMYSYSFKNEVLIEFSNKFKEFLLRGIKNLNVKPSECLYCHPNLNAFSFHHPDTDDLMIRYVIGKDEKGYNQFILEECRNRPISKGKNGDPF
ncbi:hypothetical protein ACFQZW_11550 [Lutibacter aestuarii]|uniref:Uncharacterized protein n=1 Tax=Lutibacter aestuarii TaxID=861111 RepID=A0ABW2ZAF0_9FLAO